MKAIPDNAEKADNEESEKKQQSKKLKNKKIKENAKKKNAQKDKEEKPADEAIDCEFNIIIQPSSGASFEIKVSSQELVHEIHQLLMDREDTCHRTCFCLMLDNIVLDNFAELKTIEGLKEGSVIKAVETPYTVRESRIHVRHIRDLLKALDHADSYNGQECSSLSFLNIICQTDIFGMNDKKKNIPESVDCTPPEYILPGSTERPLIPLQPFVKEQKPIKCLQEFNLSPWNPPPGYRKLQGDILYLYVVTNEGRKIYITSTPAGYYINESTDDNFDPRPAGPSYLSHSLIDLLNQLSISFKKNFTNLQKKRTSKHPFERVATPYQIYTWTAPMVGHFLDSIRAEDAFSSKLGYEEHIPGQTRDWNEELQTTRELARKTLLDRLLRERAIFKVHSDFVSAATRGSIAVVDGNVMAINPGDDPTMQMFIWNNIFFSLGFDVKDHYKELGGNAAAFVAPKNDLQGVEVYAKVDLEGLYTLGTVVVDYKGYRVTAQSIIPGILEKEQEQSVVYGSIDFGKTVVAHQKYLDLLKNAGQHLKICSHSVLNEKNEEVELCSSIECKGIIGNDGRHYILDLLRTFPPDMNYLPYKGVELLEGSKKMGYPIPHKHKLVSLRQELIESYVDAKYLQFFQYVATNLRKINTPELQNDEIDDAQPDDDKNGEKASSDKTEESTNEVIKKAALAVGSLKESDFDIKFNPDVFSPFVRHADSTGKKAQRDRELVIDAANFIVTAAIPNVVKDLIEIAPTALDGSAVCQALHARGINLRYLGKVAEQFCGKEMSTTGLLCISEIIVRSTRHIYTEYIQNVDSIYSGSAVAHFLNCFLSSCNNPQPKKGGEEVVTSKKKKKKGYSGNINQTEFALLTPRNLWSQIKNEIKTYFSFNLEADSIDSVADRYSIQKISLLRTFCLRCGIQLLLRDYSFDNKSQSFGDEDIMNLFPVAKYIHPKATDAGNLYTAGQAKIQSGALQEAFELISESLNLLNNVFGAMHPEISHCLRVIARISYIIGDYVEALGFQQKATFMSERVNGIDHPSTIQEYIHMALYCFAARQTSVSLKLLYRARYLILIVYGEVHPLIATVDTNIGLILHAESQYSLSLKFLEKALELNIKFFGVNSMKTALSYHLVARTQSCMGDFRTALNYEKETYTIYKEQLGADHDKTKEADECLRHLTSQAVVMAKRMSEVISGKNIGVFPPIHIQNPSMSNVLEMLNVANGILYIQVNSITIDRIKKEMNKARVLTIENESQMPDNHDALQAAFAKLAINTNSVDFYKLLDATKIYPPVTVEDQPLIDQAA